MSRAAGVAVNDAWDGTRADGGPGGTMPPRGPATAWQKVGTGVSMQMHYVPAPGMAPAARQDEAPAGKDKGDKDKGDKDKGDKDRDDKKEDDDKKGEDDKDGGDDKKDGKGKDGKDKKGDDDKDDGKDKKKSRWPIVLLILVGILAVVGGVAVRYLMTKDQESTDDAYTEGNAVAIAPKVAGYVVERRVDDNTFVHAGDADAADRPARLHGRARPGARQPGAGPGAAGVRADRPGDRPGAGAGEPGCRRRRSWTRRAPTRATPSASTSGSAASTRGPRRRPRSTRPTTLRSSKATVDQAGAQVQVASLVPQNIAAAETTVKQRQAQVAQAEANLAQAELNLSYTEMRAPQDGLVTRRNVDVGTYAQAGQQVFYLVRRRPGWSPTSRKRS